MDHDKGTECTTTGDSSTYDTRNAEKINEVHVEGPQTNKRKHDVRGYDNTNGGSLFTHGGHEGCDMTHLPYDRGNDEKVMSSKDSWEVPERGNDSWTRHASRTDFTVM